MHYTVFIIAFERANKLESTVPHGSPQRVLVLSSCTGYKVSHTQLHDNASEHDQTIDI